MMKTTKEQLKELAPLLGTEGDEFYKKANDVVAGCNTPEDDAAVSQFLNEEIEKTRIELEEMKKQLIKIQLEEVSSVI